MGERWLCFILNRMIKIDLPEARVGGGEEMSQVGVGGTGVSGGGKSTCISEEVHIGQNSWRGGSKQEGGRMGLPVSQVAEPCRVLWAILKPWVSL